MSQKDFYLAKIDKIAKESFNAEQKAIAKKIIEAADEKDLDAVWGLISQRVKIGFTFDEAPEVNHQAVAVVKENEKLFINSPSATNAIEHKLIIGENYDALKNLLVTYVDSQGKGLIDVIYIDPPYNTEKSKEEGNNYKDEVEAKKFIYRDKFTRDGWLNMMNERLKLAKKLLSDKGVIFISIDDNMQAYLKVLCDEIFGEENFIDNLAVEINPKGRKNGRYISASYEYVLIYARNKNRCDKFKNIVPKKDDDWLTDENGKYSVGQRVLVGNCSNKVVLIADSDKNYTVYFKEDAKLLKIEKNEKRKYNTELLSQGYKVYQSINDYDELIENTYTQSKFEELFENNNLIFNENTIYDKDRSAFKQLKSMIIAKEIKDAFDIKTESAGFICGRFDLRKVFKMPKNVGYVKMLLSLFDKNDAIILDFFAGSGTTGQAVMELNDENKVALKFILVTNNENNIATDITRERLYRVINGKGSKGEKIEWEYSKDKKSLTNNVVRVFDIKTENLTIADIEKAEKIKVEAEKDFKKLNEKYKTKDDLDIYTQLASLNPQKSEK